MLLASSTSPPCAASLGWFASPYAAKNADLSRKDKEAAICRPCDPHNNTLKVLLSVAQIDAYSPGEDRIYVNHKDNLFAIFDGHGGDICSRYVVDRLPKQLLSSLQQRQPKNHNDYKHLLKTCFTHVDEQFLSEHKHIVKTSPAGSCGVSVLLRDDTLYVCNVGDSRVLLGSKESEWSHKLLTNDHNTKNEQECALVKSRTTDPLPLRSGITATTAGDRVGGILMVTRAFGDGIFKKRDMSLHPLIHHLPYITSEPEISIHKVLPTDRYAVISSDGLYECLTPAVVAAYVEKQLELTSDPTAIATGLLELQFEEIARLLNKTPEQVKQLPSRKSFMDDTSIIILVFQHPAPPPPVTTPVSPSSSAPIAIPRAMNATICTCESYTETISSDGIRSLSRTPTNCLSVSSSPTPPFRTKAQI